MNYLIILAILVILLIVIKNKSSQFTKLEETQPLKNEIKNITDVTDVYHLDTRFEYPTKPPVNPNVYKSLLVSSEPVSNELYSTQDYTTPGFILDQTQNNEDTNQLNYSGGSTQIIKIPLQMNEPYDEQLRSQEVMITPYNRIKYGLTC